MTYYPGIECEHGYDACPICDAPKEKVSQNPVEEQLRSACQDRCAEFGEPACYELAHEEGGKFEPCIPCLIDCGLPIPPVPLDPDAVVAPLL